MLMLIRPTNACAIRRNSRRTSWKVEQPLRKSHKLLSSTLTIVVRILDQSHALTLNYGTHSRTTWLRPRRLQYEAICLRILCWNNYIILCIHSLVLLDAMLKTPIVRRTRGTSCSMTTLWCLCRMDGFRHRATLMLQSFAAVVLSPQSFWFDVVMLEEQTLILLLALISIRLRARLSSLSTSTVANHMC